MQYLGLTVYKNAQVNDFLKNKFTQRCCCQLKTGSHPNDNNTLSKCQTFHKLNRNAR